MVDSELPFVWPELTVHLPAAEIAAAAARKEAKRNQKLAQKVHGEQTAAAKVRAAQQKAQQARSAAFAAARKGDDKAVRKAVWEEGISAPDPEFILPLSQAQINEALFDHKETLLHIAVQQDLKDLVEWLLKHGKVCLKKSLCLILIRPTSGATLEERDSNECNAFHCALAGGKVAIVKCLLAQYPLSDPENLTLLSPPNGESLLSLALSSSSVETIKLILPHASVGDVSVCWKWLSTIVQGLGHGSREPIYDQLLNMLAAKEGFRPPPVRAPSTPPLTPTMETSSVSSSGGIPPTPDTSEPAVPIESTKNSTKPRFRSKPPINTTSSFQPRASPTPPSHSHTPSQNVSDARPKIGQDTAGPNKTTQTKPRRRRPKKPAHATSTTQ